MGVAAFNFQMFYDNYIYSSPTMTGAHANPNTLVQSIVAHQDSFNHVINEKKSFKLVNIIPISQ